MPSSTQIFVCLFIYVLTQTTLKINARIHHLSLTDDTREQITISTFGYLKNGLSQVNVDRLSFNPRLSPQTIGNSFAFVYEKAKTGGFSSFTEDRDKQDFCSALQRRGALNSTSASLYMPQTRHSNSMIIFSVDLISKKVNIMRIGKDLKSLNILSSFQSSQGFNAAQFEKSSTTSASPNATTRLTTLSDQESEIEQLQNDFAQYSLLESFDLIVTNKSIISFQFEVNIKTPSEEGLYILNFFNCFQQQKLQQQQKRQDKSKRITENGTNSNIHRDDLADSFYNNDFKLFINLELDLLERNEGSYLSGGEMPEPTLYFTWSIIYFLAGLSWMYILRASKGDVFKVHYLMLALVIIKSISLTFHAINMHYIAVNGRHEAIWAILYYITYVLRGLLLIVSIILVGTGWTFVKHILSENERRLFVIVIPLQILTITAYIFLEEKEEGDAVYLTWRQLFQLVDLICCGAILFPVVWSIRHLEQASQTDGKMITNLKKLKIFKHFYIMVICYIYFTRIIGYLLKQMLPFRYVWFDEFCTEIVTFIFFALTAYKFQPASNNPYLQLSQDDENECLNELLSAEDGTETVLDLTEFTSRNGSSSNGKSSEDTSSNLPSGPNSNNPNLFSRKQMIPSTQL